VMSLFQRPDAQDAKRGGEARMKYKKAITLSRAQLFRAGAVLVITTLLLVAAAATAQTYTVLYNFGTNIGDPLNPQLSDVIAQGRDGSLYSTTFSGGAHGLGTVFDITPGATLTVLYDFDGTLGELPNSGLTLATDGKFYGTTAAGGPSNAGTIFNTTPSGKVTVLYNFTGGSDGFFPSAPPIQGTDGNFYGTTPYGGHKTCNGGAGCGTVYKLTRSGQFTTLHQFQSKEGAVPPGPVVEGTDGNLYGTTVGGGTYNAGVVFKLTTAGKYTVLHNFDPYSDGKDPVGPLVQGSDGNFYGTTVAGRDGQIRGVVFKITPTGSLTVLHRLNGTTDGDNPYSGLVQATDGNFYGTASAGGTFGSGTIFRLSPKRTFTVLHNFDNTTGAYPQITLMQHTNGLLYGETALGGTGTHCGSIPCGVFYSLNVGLGPFVTLLPYSGKVGNTIEFLGQGLTGATAVSFNGTGAPFKVVSDTLLTATVPGGATTGFVTVTTPDGTFTSNKKFRVKR
jgi:uncharacterized repeat protein (TIGR03803 family)